jgi:hypothetical protein
MPGRSLVRGRDVCESRQAVDVSVSGVRPVWAGHRCAGIRGADLAATPPVLLPRASSAVHTRPRSIPTAHLPTHEYSMSCCPPPHIVEQYANNPIEAGHSRLKARLRPMRGLKTALSASGQRRAHLHPESPTRPLRSRCRCQPQVSASGGLHRTRPRHLNRASTPLSMSTSC